MVEKNTKNANIMKIVFISDFFKEDGIGEIGRAHV